MRHEEPLVRLGESANALSVSPIVNTKGYHDAFRAMPLPAAVVEAAYRQAGRILSATDGTEFEYLVAIDARTGALVADNLDALPMVRRRTAFRESDVDKIWARENGVVLIHNHPMSFQPSFRDVMTAAEHVVVVASVVIGHDGSVWYVAVDDPTIAGKLADAYNEIKDSLGDFAESMVLKTVLNEDNGKHVDWRRMR
ncbi:MAG: hypothetical protein DBY20_03500 [Coriobacteriia bacterium]|nr:MAG: hypothetical protein DBY20_03500 [Coriobacteriia bacterium]